MRRILIAAALAALLGCETKPSYVTIPEPPNERGNEKAFIEYARTHLQSTLEKVTCHCCGHTLAVCLGKMGTPGSCPFT